MRLILASGLTLFEVLISLLLLSFVLLGLDVMELSALQLQRKAYFSALAGRQLHNLQERLRVVGSREGLGEQVAAWHGENSRLFPQGRGRVEGHYPAYTITLCTDAEEAAECLNERYVLA